MINVVSVKGPESCRGRLGLREETGGVSYEPPGTCVARSMMTRALRSILATGEPRRPSPKASCTKAPP